MNSYKLSISSSSSSSSDSYEDRRLQRVKENKEIDDMLDNLTQTHLPHIVNAVTPRMRPGGRGEPRRDRDREVGHIRLFNDYFADPPVYSKKLFRRRFRMRKHVFLRIMKEVVANDEWFIQKLDSTGRLGLSPLQKCTAAIRMLAYGVAADQVDEYIRISESTARLALLKFIDGVINQFGDEYLRRPTPDDLARLRENRDKRGFPGMIGSIDCMHWKWKNCLVAWKRQYQGREGIATLVLEVVASQDLWIWHSFFGMPGSCNDLNVLHRSPIFEDVLEGRGPPVSFVVNGNEYNKGYYLTHGIYPKWATFVKTILSPQTHKHKLFSMHQEAARKDVERAFGVLQSRFAIIRKPSLAWVIDVLHKIMLACIIMHNMIVEDERDKYKNYDNPNEFNEDRRRINLEDDDGGFQYNKDRILDIGLYMRHKEEIEDHPTHLALQHDLIENIWRKFGRNDS